MVLDKEADTVLKVAVATEKPSPPLTMLLEFNNSEVVVFIYIL
jgi:hypothetical protein